MNFSIRHSHNESKAHHFHLDDLNRKRSCYSEHRKSSSQNLQHSLNSKTRNKALSTLTSQSKSLKTTNTAGTNQIRQQERSSYPACFDLFSIEGSEDYDACNRGLNTIRDFSHLRIEHLKKVLKEVANNSTEPFSFPREQIKADWKKDSCDMLRDSIKNQLDYCGFKDHATIDCHGVATITSYLRTPCNLGRVAMHHMYEKGNEQFNQLIENTNFTDAKSSSAYIDQAVNTYSDQICNNWKEAQLGPYSAACIFNGSNSDFNFLVNIIAIITTLIFLKIHARSK